MKLQNLLYATMVTCAFQCLFKRRRSEYSDPYWELDATLTVGFSAIGANKAPSTFSTPVTINATDSEVDRVGIAVLTQEQCHQLWQMVL